MKRLTAVILMFIVLISSGAAAKADLKTQALPEEKRTEAQKGECAEAREEFLEKFRALSAKQKAELYKISEDAVAQTKKLIEKYGESGIIDKAEVKRLGELLDAGSLRVREDNLPPMGILPPRLVTGYRDNA